MGGEDGRALANDEKAAQVKQRKSMEYGTSTVRVRYEYYSNLIQWRPPLRERPEHQSLPGLAFPLFFPRPRFQGQVLSDCRGSSMGSMAYHRFPVPKTGLPEFPAAGHAATKYYGGTGCETETTL
jgi:hypothetical protein